WWAVPIVAIWSNAHVESVLGVAFLMAFAAAEVVRPAVLPRREARRAAMIGMACALALLATPYGAGIFRYFVENTALPRILTIVEVEPPYLPAYRAFYAYVVVLAVLLAARPQHVALWEVLIVCAFGTLGCRYLRLTPLLFCAPAPIVARRIAYWMGRG